MRLRDQRGQTTVEFVLIGSVVLIIVVVLGVLWQHVEGGQFVEHALAAASHHVACAMPGSIADVFLY